ncbi:MAG: ATP-binding protein [Crocinitomicaceae bacterium]|nr:ATP-binding protein [Crocinitomicaceae bacterium]|tara:strand:+ start:499 stop:1197 length:699 start_codon:yes stop_codon:yes gene_type:complete
MEKFKTALFWSGGKDAAMALHEFLQSEKHSVDYLVCTFHRSTSRLSMHGVRPEIIKKQVDLIGLPLYEMWVEGEGNKAYESAFQSTLTALKSKGITHIAFGDIFLEDLKAYRDDFLANNNLKAVYPLWKKDTTQLVQQFTANGFEAIIVCASNHYFDEDILYTPISNAFMHSLPSKVDPCGENGEFHTLCVNAPFFASKLVVKTNGVTFKALPLSVEKNEPKLGFFYGDLLL